LRIQVKVGLLVKRIVAVLFPAVLLLAGCPKEKDPVYTIGLFQVNEAPTLREVRRGFLQALEDHGLRDGVNIRLKMRSAENDITRVHRIARDFVLEKVDLLVALSTPCLQAALMAGPQTPIVFASVANPYLLGVGRSAEDHLDHVTGVTSTAPVAEMLAFIREALPGVRRLGTLYTPAELNSEYYLELLRRNAPAFGFEVVAIPVGNSSQIPVAAQSLLNKKIEAISQISDNTINASFEVLGRLAEENGIPLFGGHLYSTRSGACAALGWDFSRMGYKAGEIAVRVRQGESPGRIPIQDMKEIKLSLNEGAAARQGVHFSPDIVQRADEVIAAPLAGPKK
jgi:putative ABC transport system substrate-binding protein